MKHCFCTRLNMVIIIAGFFWRNSYHLNKNKHLVNGLNKLPTFYSYGRGLKIIWNFGKYHPPLYTVLKLPTPYIHNLLILVYKRYQGRSVPEGEGLGTLAAPIICKIANSSKIIAIIIIICRHNLLCPQ